jgi:uncharacterized repeat protein (TIGR01451 family)
MRMAMRLGLARRGLLLVVVAFGAYVGVSASAAVASECSSCAPWWHVVSDVRPSNLAPGGEGTISVQAINIGDAPTTGVVRLSDVLPAGMSVVEEEVEIFVEGKPEVVSRPAVQFYTFPLQQGARDVGPTGQFRSLPLPEGEACEVAGATVTCALKPQDMELFEAIAPEVFAGAKELKAFEDLEIRIPVRVTSGGVSGVNRVSVSGGGAPVAHVSSTVQVSGVPPVFGVEDFAMVPEEAGGGVDVQAGSHPFQLTTSFALNQTASPFKPPALPRDLQFNLPAGLIGNAITVPRCTEAQFQTVVNGQGNLCPQDTVVGVAALTIDEPITLGLRTIPVPLFNLTPAAGEPARFGFEIVRAPVTLDTSVRTGSDYGVSVHVSNISQLANFLSNTVVFWGVPGDVRHDEARGWGCLAGGKFVGHALPCAATTGAHSPPFLTMPSSCSLPFVASVEGSSWPTRADPSGLPLAGGEHGEYSLRDVFDRPLQVSGCNRLPFAPSIEVAPDVQSASTPTGLSVHVRVPQEVNENPLGLASSSLKDITVALPEGVTVSPAGAGGLQACSEAQIGFQRIDTTATDLFTSSLPSPFCPNASKIGTVKIKLPVVADPLEGAVYLASQNANPFGSLVAMYVVAEDPVSGVLIKLAGEVHLTGTGQLITTFKSSPQGPLEEAEFHFFGGSRAPLETPAHCGSYTTNASFVPWAAEPSDPSSATRTASSTFAINSGPNGTPCPGASLPFSPSLTGGMTNINAGAFSPLTTTIGRADGQQDMQSVQLHMPAGLSGILAGVKLCPEAQANEGSCGPESLIGETTVSAGLGSEPVSVTGGKVYITEKYGGAPFGLSIVNPVKTGPFDLEHDTASASQNPACDCVVVRAKIEVDLHTAALTITTDASGAHAIPHMIDGVPVQIKHVNVLINRPGFTFNPTNCNPAQITGSIASTEGASSPVSVPFQVTNCASLAFKPGFAVSATGKNSKANGAALSVKLAYPAAPFGSQANISKVKVELPKQLPSRLTTLQKACTNAQFEANPAGCPAASIIGHARATTPLLPVPLEGPAYFVSHGGEAFPSLIIVLQGYGVTLDLVGTTFISKAGITSSTFKTVPDAPVGTFELTLPQGKFSALAANGNLCTSKLTMPTEFVAQNGAKINQNTPVSVTGCAKKKALTRAQKLAAALKACKKKTKGKRASCVRQAHRRYGPVKAKKKK